MDNIEFLEGQDAADIANRIAAFLDWALATSEGDLAIAVPGGSTPFPIFEELSGLDLDFTRLVIWPTDDRIVPEDHAASNTGKIRDIFEPLGALVSELHEEAQPPEFALVWLGMGADGHIASLFPNTDPQNDEPRGVLRLTPDPLPPEAPFDRITLTMPSLLNTSMMIFVIRGDEKRAVFAGAIKGEHDLPITRLLSAAETAPTGPPQITCFT